MIKKVFKILLIVLSVVGIAISIVNLTFESVKAGQITKFGTYLNPGDDEKCPGAASNCVIVWYIPDG